ncbi:MAG: hypothetical protein CMC36_03250 [Flavobacteriaceae bacterium]|nr:hypothetical protein [Flavobacteriaceae bacterium]|tara:strand:- start:22649 stop:23221 length:573 start_codon:yes stop_codon:yes gene_type:complete
MGKIIISLFFFTLITFSCNEPNLPKQNGFLRIEFKEPYYTIHEEIDNPFNFYYNSNYTYIDHIGSDQFLFDYKDLNLSLNLSFYSIKTKLDLEKKSRDFSLILDTHIKKSNGIVLREYDNDVNRMFGKLYEMKGDVASPIQFYLTDSVSNFISGSVNLKFKSNYDSIYPSIQYVKNDILVLFESINWNMK